MRPRTAFETALSEGSPEAFARTRCECIARHFVGDHSANELSPFDEADGESEAGAKRLKQAEAACDAS